MQDLNNYLIEVIYFSLEYKGRANKINTYKHICKLPLSFPATDPGDSRSCFQI